MSDASSLRVRVCGPLQRAAARVLYYDVEGAEPDAATIDALARIALAAKRRGGEMQLKGASTELRELVAFMGLGDVLPG